MRVQAGFLTLFLMSRGTSALYDLPDAPLNRDRQLIDIFDTIHSDVLKRSTHDARFPLNFNVANQVLSSGKFQGAQLSVKCVECSTTGEVVASAMLPDISDIDITQPGDVFDDSMLGLTFNGVGATIDLDLTAAASGDFSVPLLTSESPIGVSGPGFQIGVVFSVDLVLKVDGEVETEGGFKVTIPDGASFIILFDDSKPNVAKFNGASASLLPITVNLPASVTAALQLKVEAGVMLPDIKVFEAKALAGASISIPELILKESASFPSKTCAVPVSAEVNINAGVFVDIGADIAGIDLGDFNPTASTTLFAASTSTCLKSVGGNSTATATPSATRHSGGTIPTKDSDKSSSSFPSPTTFSTARTSAPQSLPSQDTSKFGAPSSFAVFARATHARRSAYPITLQSLATPIINFATAIPTVAYA
ncbi:hypothetical protein F5B22DRAFT_621842 [Xylaria bambusicola]|uniref:uncharacterized protein n=1 Tax=Xylaria bambusicola TaxID=326684 RepID=UPI002007ACEC|nr:uncharacterized protein F5B22DRAFT_621842 [Xylaria bambusicola]KAI0506912.1 hypothetical protein F5B22DRAFT_621842 [Xylaria bambusicola]